MGSEEAELERDHLAFEKLKNMGRRRESSPKERQKYRQFCLGFESPAYACGP